MKDKLKQLQLDNYVLVQDGKLLENKNSFRIGKVNSISTESIKVDNKAVNHYNFKFIPITDEWLIKLGFTLTDEDSNQNFKRYEHKFSDFNILSSNYFKLITKESDFVYVSYVHELQNFFFICFKIIL